MKTTYHGNFVQLQHFCTNAFIIRDVCVCTVVCLFVCFIFFYAFIIHNHSSDYFDVQHITIILFHYIKKKIIIQLVSRKRHENEVLVRTSVLHKNKNVSEVVHLIYNLLIQP